VVSVAVVGIEFGGRGEPGVVRAAEIAGYYDGVVFLEEGEGRDGAGGGVPFAVVGDCC